MLVPRRRAHRRSRSDPSRSSKPVFGMRKPKIINSKNVKQLHKRKLIKARGWSQRRGRLLGWSLSHLCWSPNVRVGSDHLGSTGCFPLNQGGPDPVLEGQNPARFSDLQGRQVRGLSAWEDRNPRGILALGDWICPPLDKGCKFRKLINNAATCDTDRLDPWFFSWRTNMEKKSPPPCDEILLIRY